jgi:hypothetical protein
MQDPTGLRLLSVQGRDGRDVGFLGHRAPAIHWAQDEEMMLNVRLVTILASAMFQESSLVQVQ